LLDAADNVGGKGTVEFSNVVNHLDFEVGIGMLGDFVSRDTPHPFTCFLVPENGAFLLS
jgi:hypothetical protein